MFSYITTHSYDNNGFTQKVYEITDNSKSYCIIELETTYIIIDKHYLDDVMKFNWKIDENGNITNNKKVLPNFIKNLESNSFDIKKTLIHINGHKNDNRVSNLSTKIETTGLTRKIRSNRKPPIVELVELGITDYPRHIRFDTSQKRFIVEKTHPLLKNKNMRINGTRIDISLIEKYFEILHIAYYVDIDFIQLNNTIDTCEKFDGRNISELNIYIELANCLNNHTQNTTISLEDVYETFSDVSSLFKTQIDILNNKPELQLKDPNILAEEKGFVLTRKLMRKLPPNIYFTPERNGIGCSFAYDFTSPETKVRKYIRFTKALHTPLEKKYLSALTFTL
jgi:hypothetical protein